MQYVSAYVMFDYCNSTDSNHSNSMSNKGKKTLPFKSLMAL
jgi:hypothetical protein